MGRRQSLPIQSIRDPQTEENVWWSSMPEPTFLRIDDDGRVTEVRVDILYRETVGAPEGDRIQEYCFTDERRRSEIEELRVKLDNFCLDFIGEPATKGTMYRMEATFRGIAGMMLAAGNLTPWSQWDRLQTGS